MMAMSIIVSCSLDKRFLALLSKETNLRLEGV